MDSKDIRDSCTKRPKKRLRNFTTACTRSRYWGAKNSGRVKQRLGDKARVEEEKPESRRLFSPDLDEIVQATARGYEKTVEELKRRKRGRENEARMVAIYLGRQLGGHRHEEIGKTDGLGKTSSVSSAYLLMKERGEGEAASAKSAED